MYATRVQEHLLQVKNNKPIYAIRVQEHNQDISFDNRKHHIVYQNLA